jgi:iron(III) transport system substrate-binding protein
MLGSPHALSRRRIVQLGLASVGALVVACGGAAAPTATNAPAKPAEPTKPAAGATTAPAAASPAAATTAASVPTATGAAAAPTSAAPAATKPATASTPATQPTAAAAGAVAAEKLGVPKDKVPKSSKLVLYSATVQEQTAKRIEAFKAWVTKNYEADVDVTHIYASTVEGFNRARGEMANAQADVLDTTNDLAIQAKRIGLTQPYKIGSFDTVPAFARDPDGFWYAPTVSVFVIDYNTETVKADEAPKDWEDLIKPRYKNKLILRDPTQSGSGGTIVLGFLAIYGEDAGKDFLYRLDSQVGGKYLENSTQTVLDVGRGAADALIWNEAYSLQVKYQQNFPNVGVVYPKSWMLAEMTTTNILKGTKNPVPAQLWIEWSMSLESAKLNAQNYSRPSRTDLPAADLPDWMKQTPTDKLPVVNLDAAKLEEKRKDWLALWSGQIKGKGADYVAKNPTPPKYEIKKDFVLS